MSLGEELKKMDEDRTLNIFNRIWAQMAHAHPESTDPVFEEFPALDAMTLRAYTLYEIFSRRVRGETVASEPPIEMPEDDVESMIEFIRGVSIGVWISQAALSEYATTENFIFENEFNDHQLGE